MIRSPRAILALLTILNLLNYFDRFVVNAVGPRIQEHLGISTSQLGLVASVFMVGYLVTSPIFGWLGDRYPRKGLIATGVGVWSLATIASGFAPSLAPLLASRAVVGVGEASYAALSPTIIDDVAPRDSKNRWLGVFYVAISVGSALGVLVGGMLERWFGWRNAFFIAGGPGLVAALVTLLVAEPARTTRETRAKSEGAVASFVADQRALAKRRLYVLTVLGYTAQTFALGGFIFAAVPFLYRKHCLDLHVADFSFGALTVVTGIIGTAVGSVIADRVPGEDRVRASLLVCAVSSLLGTPLAFAAILAPTSTGFLALLGLCEVFVFASMAPTNFALLHSVPPALRAGAMATSIFVIHALGDVLSPPLVGAVSDAFGDGITQCSSSKGLVLGMLILPVALGLSSVLWWIGARRVSRPGTA
ncbi:spinster family MFS transporter [Polyangium aurulentum]|uniref:spinster family MFS transporter n=1 Tax=Polyangium aurulentum TaxID=2567896 RepID=UPI0010AE6CCC|nr:MFS transporter [Polyangium aurulentum]UQA62125.1 MFS transporter [Polyangium aurulentum]